MQDHQGLALCACWREQDCLRVCLCQVMPPGRHHQSSNSVELSNQVRLPPCASGDTELGADTGLTVSHGVNQPQGRDQLQVSPPLAELLLSQFRCLNQLRSGHSQLVTAREVHGTHTGS